MEQCISKSALAAAIEKAIKNIYAGREYVGIPYDEECVVRGLQKSEDIINIIDAKEVDLEDDVDKILESYDWNYDKINFYQFAKHFFELGIKAAQKGE